MAFVTDPDDLDRYQILVDPEAETINIRGLGAAEDLTNGSAVYEKTDGQIISGSTDNFQSSTSDFLNGPVAVSDVLVIANPTTSGCIDFWVVDVINSATSLDISNAITGADPSMTVGGCTFAVHDPTAVAGGQGGNVGDGVTMQALYSFLKEEWRTLSNSNMPDLIKFTFPLESITREQFEIGGPTHSDWDFANDYTRYLIRTGGWALVDSNNVVQEHWPGIITLGSLDDDTQVYFLQESSTSGTPEDFQLTGTVNQSIRTLSVKSGSSEVYGGTNAIAFADADPDTITRSTGSWITDGYASGDIIQIVGAEDSANNGYYEIYDVSPSDVITLYDSASLTANASDTTVRINAMTDNRDYLKLFARKKAKTYADSEISDIGVSEIETIVNRFPLTHADDAAISYDDGQLAGDPSLTVFATVEQVGGTTTDGSLWSTGSGTFWLESATSTFVTDNMHPGDTIELVEGDAYDGFYEVYSVLGETSLLCFEEPGSTMGTVSNEDFKKYTRWDMQQSSTGQIQDAAGTGSGTLTDSSNNFDTEGVAIGDMVVIEGGVDDPNHLGIYKVLGVPTTTVAVLDTSDEDTFPGSPDSNVVYHVLHPTMALQYKSRDATARGPLAGGFKFNPNGDLGYRIRRETAPYDWDADGYIAGGTVTVANATSGEYDGTYLITAVSGDANTDDTIFVIDPDGTFPTWYNDQDIYDDTTATTTGTYGFIRTLNGVDYSFNWRMFGNGGDLSECFQWLQRQMRRGRGSEDSVEADIDYSSGVYRGDITDLLMNYATPTGTTLNMYIDDLDSTELNNVTMQDLLSQDRNFAYIAGVQINLNANILNSASNKVVVFFTNPDVNNGDALENEFGTVNAIIVDDKDGVDMQAVNQTTSPLNFEFDYDNNVQGNRNPAEGATPVTIVAICTDTGQYVQTTGNITRTSSNVFSLVASLERNYANP